MFKSFKEVDEEQEVYLNIVIRSIKFLKFFMTYFLRTSRKFDQKTRKIATLSLFILIGYTIVLIK